MTKRVAKTAAVAKVDQTKAPATNNVTVAMFARANGINPKTVRAKLRRIAKKTDSAIKHNHKESWKFTPEIAAVFNVDHAEAVNNVTEFFAKAKAA